MKHNGRAASSFTGIAVIILIILFIMFNALIIIQGLMNPFSSVRSDSMSPGIEMNDGVIKVPLDSQDLQVGQVIVFSDPSDGTQHLIRRIVEVQQKNGLTYYVTKGDRDLVNDPYPVLAGNVEGIVSASIPWLGPVLDFSRSTYGFMVTVLLPSLIIIFYLVVRHRRRKRPATPITLDIVSDGKYFATA